MKFGFPSLTKDIDQEESILADVKEMTSDWAIIATKRRIYYMMKFEQKKRKYFCINQINRFVNKIG